MKQFANQSNNPGGLYWRSLAIHGIEGRSQPAEYYKPETVNDSRDCRC